MSKSGSRVGARIVTGKEVGDNDGDVLFLAGSAEHVGKGASHDVSDCTLAETLGDEVVEVGRHFIEEDEDRAGVIKKGKPVFFLRRPRAFGPETAEKLTSAQLGGDVALEGLKPESC